jgi:hypothetical protein
MEDDGGLSLAINVKKGFQPVVLSVEVHLQFSLVNVRSNAKSTSKWIMKILYIDMPLKFTQKC